jgi:hypothetical protein
MIKVLKGSRDHRTKAEQANENSITHLIKTLATRQDKVDLVTERNPLHYMFGEYLATRNYEEKYEDFINRNYIGEAHEKSTQPYTTA